MNAKRAELIYRLRTFATPSNPAWKTIIDAADEIKKLDDVLYEIRRISNDTQEPKA